MHANSKNPGRLVPAVTLLALNLALASQARAQTWATNSPLQVARWQHTATLLTNGTVLITGGLLYNTNGNSQSTSACELYDPSAGTSSLTGSMVYGRNQHTATLLPNGQVLVAGGPSATSEVYDPPSGAWINFASMNDNREAHTATLLTNGLVLVAGGYDAFGGGELSSAELYDAGSGTWTNTGPMPYGMDTAAAVLLPDGRVLVCGGSTDDSGSSTNAILYNPANQTWTDTTPMNTARGGHSATLLPNGTVLVAGGGDNSAEIYDPAAATWTYVASMNDGRRYTDAALLNNGQVMVFGDGGTDVELYDPINDAWTFTDSLPIAGTFQTLTLLPGGQVVVTGGSVSYYNGPALAVVETYGSTVTNPGLTVIASPQAGLAPLSVQFTSPGADSLGDTVTNWNWDFGDGTSSTAQSPAHLYTAVGSFSPSLVAYSTFGAAPLTVTGPGMITVTTPALAVTASPQSGLAPLTTQFTSPGVDSGGNTVTNWNWDFGDGTISTAQSPSHVYTNVGTFSPSLVARSTYGAAPLGVTGPGAITVTNPILAVTANPQAGVVPLAVQFASPGVDSAGYTVTNWNWNFGDGATSTAQSPKHIYATIGYFTPSLAAYSTHGRLPLSVTGLGLIAVTNPPNPFFRTIYSFTGTNNGSGPSPVILSGSTLYGAAGSGSTGYGTLFAVNTDGTGFTNLCNFTKASGIGPSAVILSGSTLYGTTWLFGDLAGSGGWGNVFAVNTNGTGFTNLYTFTSGGPGTGAEPLAGVALLGNTLYGLTEYGGFYTHGVLFSVNTDGSSFRDLLYFDSPSAGNNNYAGLYPQSRLVISGSTLYGTAEGGGAYAAGTVFAYDTVNGFRILHYFSAPDGVTGTNADGAYPFTGLVISGNTLYGVTPYGGTTDNGVVYAVNTDGSGFTNLYNFTGGSDGANPQGRLTVSGTTLVGSTRGGGLTNGTLFAINTDGSGFATLYNFTGGSDGSNPAGDLFLAGNTLYGASGGGSSGNGVVFSFTLPSIILTNLIKLPGGSFQFNFLHGPGSTNTVLATTNISLASSNWTVLGRATEVTSGQFQFIDTQATNVSRRFYRVRSP